MLDNFFGAKLDHHFEIVILLTPAVAMEVEVQKLNAVLELWLQVLSHEFSSKGQLFAYFQISKQINHHNWTISVYNIPHMHFKRLFSLGGRPRDSDGFFETFLLPKDWDRSSNLDVRKQSLFVDLKDLFSLALVANKAQILYPPINLLRPWLAMHASCN